MDTRTIIEQAFENPGAITPDNASDEVRSAINETIDKLDSGELRVAEKVSGDWQVNQWLKKAVLLSFRINNNTVMGGKSVV